MSPTILAILLSLAVAAIWIACLAVLRLPRALDRLHAVAFLNAAAGFSVTLAAFVADGVSGRSLKIALLMTFLVAWSAVLSHVVGRALLLREGSSA